MTNLVPHKQFEINGSWSIGEIIEFDILNYPDLVLINKDLITDGNSRKCYLYNIIQGDNLFTFDNCGTFGNNNTRFSNYPTLFYNKYNKILLTIYIKDNYINIETYEINKTDYKIQSKKNRIMFNKIYPDTYIELENTNNFIIYSDNTFNVIDINTLEIKFEYDGQFQIQQMNSSNFKYGYLFLSKFKKEVLIYNYIYNEITEIITMLSDSCTMTPVMISRSNPNYTIIYNGKKTMFYKFIDEDKIPSEDKCVICFSKTEKNKVLVPCGHRQFCEKCISKNFENCSICRTKIEKIIKIF